VSGEAVNQDKQYDDLVEVATAPNPMIAATWRDLLWQEGIPASVKCNDPLAVAYFVPSPYPCKIVVPENYAERAREVLASLGEELGEENWEDERNPESDSQPD
jgi:hypothetical protein